MIDPELRRLLNELIELTKKHIDSLADMIGMIDSISEDVAEIRDKLPTNEF